MKKFCEAVMVWKSVASLMFTGGTLVWCAIMLAMGKNMISIPTLASILIVSVLGTLLRMLVFSDRMIKKLRYSLRLLIFAVLFLAVLAANAYFFNWFPKGAGYWVTFALVFLLIFAGMSIGYEVYFYGTSKKYDGLLGQYRKRRELAERGERE